MINAPRRLSEPSEPSSQNIIDIKRLTSRTSLPDHYVSTACTKLLVDEQTALKEIGKHTIEQQSRLRTCRTIQPGKVRDDATTTELATDFEILSNTVADLLILEPEPSTAQTSRFHKSNPSSRRRRQPSSQQQSSKKQTGRTANINLIPSSGLTFDSSLRDASEPPAMRAVSFLVASLGNPPPYQSTRHSAGHIVLQHLRSIMDLPSFTQKSRPYGGGHVSAGSDTGRPEFTLYQSAVQMNVSGPPLLKAWKHFTDIQDVNARTPALILLHDEMEINPGRIKIRRGNGSAKGHNGIKSVQASFQGAGILDHLGDRFVKIGIGIGRPTGGSRLSNDVSDYVLGQLTSNEKDDLEQAAEEAAAALNQELARIGQS